LAGRPRVLVSAGGSLRQAIRAGLVGFDVVEATDDQDIAALAVACRPDALVVDATDAERAARTVLTLRRDFRTAFTPTLLIVGELPSDGFIGGWFRGADDYVVEPFEPEELAGRVRLSLRRSSALRGVNPVTGLPGSGVVGEEIARRLVEETPFACLHVDLDDFKAFNDRYGFARGDEVIRTVARSVVEVLEAQAPAVCFAGHVGGDDFVLLTPPGQSVEIAGAIIRRFEAFQTRCSMSIGVVEAGDRFAGPPEVAEAAARAKSLAKRRRSSAWAFAR
jgi:diguanylate cyclase (GGDEF)-like protein